MRKTAGFPSSATICAMRFRPWWSATLDKALWQSRGDSLGRNMGFDALTCEKMSNYVYALVDPRYHLADPRGGKVTIESRVPFYIGRGAGNRVFEHVACALKNPTKNDKYSTILAIQKSGKSVEHFILRHGLSPREAVEVEATIIDFARMVGLPVANVAGGYHSGNVGFMNTDEVIRIYNAPPLSELAEGHVIININKTYGKAPGQDAIYEATRASWIIAKWRIPSISHVLSEKQGVIVGVFEVTEWYSERALTRTGKPTTKWAFYGKIAENHILERYMHKSITKKRGDRHPVRFKI
jgi:uncharacterized protein